MSRRGAVLTFCAFVSVLPCPPIAADPPRDQETARRIEALVSAYAAAGHFNGCVLVARGDEVLCRGAFGPANREWPVALTPDTRFMIGSLSKAFTAVAALQLVQEGRLSLETRLAECLPELPSEQGERITIRHLLTHTSGLGHYGQVPEFEASLERLHHSPAEMIKYVGGIGLLFEPGARFGYSSFGYDLLAYVCERREGRPFSEVLRQRIFSPAGLTRTTLADFRSLDDRRASGYEYDLVSGYQNATFVDSSNLVGAGGIQSTVDDLHRWVQALVQGRLLGEPWRTEAFRPQAAVDANRAYGYGWFVSTNPDGEAKELSHTGSTNGFNSLISLSPGDGQLVVLLSNVRSNLLGGNRRYKLATLKDDILSTLKRRAGPQPQASAVMQISRGVSATGAVGAVEAYRRLKRERAAEHYFDELELNSLGLQLCFRAGRCRDAIEILALNIEEHPNSYNVYDSMGYVLRKEGRIAEALEVFRKGIAVFNAHANANEPYRPDLEKAMELVGELEAQAGGSSR
jgi:CubicO group peptidase (beta-lactamase class C family)